MKKKAAPVSEVIYGLMFDLFKAAGMPVHANNQPQIERVAKQLSSAISKAARLEALTLIERLQKATKGGFEAFGRSLERLEKDIIENKKDREKSCKQIQKLTDSINECTELIKKDFTEEELDKPKNIIQ